MLDEKQLKEIKYKFSQHIQEKVIVKDKSEFTSFFLDNSQDSLDTAKLVFKISSDVSLQNNLGFPNFKGLLWVINSSYYSMFYLVRAILEKEGIKIKTEQSIHAVTFDAFVYYFYLTGKIEKKYVEEFSEAQEEAAQTLGKDKARSLLEDYYFEKEKRGRFTYRIGEIVLRNKAKTSLERAKLFQEELRKLFF